MDTETLSPPTLRAKAALEATFTPSLPPKHSLVNVVPIPGLYNRPLPLLD